MNNIYLKQHLDELYEIYKYKYSSNDPVWILHRLKSKGDIEILAFIISCYCYGNISSINTFISSLLRRIGINIQEFTLNFNVKSESKFLKGLSYRFNTEKDLMNLFINLKESISIHKNLQSVFLKGYNDEDENILNGLISLCINLNKIKKGSGFYNYLIPNPLNNSPCKRLNLFLRWLVRKDEIDMGIWERVPKSKLLMPVDTHVYRVSRKLNLIKRKSCDIKFAVGLTEKLKEFDADDPVKYDFALCHNDIDKIIP